MAPRQCHRRDAKQSHEAAIAISPFISFICFPCRPAIPGQHPY